MFRRAQKRACRAVCLTALASGLPACGSEPDNADESGSSHDVDDDAGRSRHRADAGIDAGVDAGELDAGSKPRNEPPSEVDAGMREDEDPAEPVPLDIPEPAVEVEPEDGAEPDGGAEPSESWRDAAASDDEPPVDVRDASVVLHDPLDAGIPGFDAAAPFVLDAAIPAPDAGGGPAPSPPESHPLASYRLAGDPIALPELSDNASDIVWKAETDTFFVVVNGLAQLHEYTSTFEDRLRVVQLQNASMDTEGLTYLGGGRFAVVSEDNELHTFVVEDGATSIDVTEAPAQRYVVTAPPAMVNRGLEGVGFRPGTGGAPGRFFVCQEGDPSGFPKRVLEFDHLPGAGSTLRFDQSLTVDEPWDAEDQLGALADDLSGLYYDINGGTLLITSDISSRLLRVEPSSGAVLEQRELSRSPQYEGVTLAGGDRLVVVSEPNFVEVFRAD